MPLHQMKALKAFRFAGRELVAGDPITATDSEKKTLEALKWAKPVKQYRTRVERVEKPETNRTARKPRTARQAGQQRRNYRRRDMQAED